MESLIFGLGFILFAMSLMAIVLMGILICKFYQASDTIKGICNTSLRKAGHRDFDDALLVVLAVFTFCGMLLFVISGLSGWWLFAWPVVWLAVFWIAGWMCRFFAIIIRLGVNLVKIM